MADLAMDGLQGLRRGEAIRASLGGRAFDLLFEARDAGFKEFVQIGAEDAKEFDSFQQRRGRVERLLEDALD